MDINAEAQQFEGLCEQYYRQPDNAQLFERLNHFQTSPESVQKLCFFMERCQNPYACLFGARCISSLISSHWEYFKTENRSSALLHFILGFVWQNGPRVGEVITKVLIQAYCKVSKLESITNEKTFNDLKLSVTRFLQSEAIEHRILGLEFYKQLLEEINTRCNTLTIAQHRKVAIKFRDEFLLDLLLDLIANLTVIKNNPSCDLNPLLEKYIDRSVELIIGIFNFDFIGTNMNDSVEDLGPIQVPSAWKPTFESLPNVNLFFELYIKFSTSSKSPRILEAISLLASVKSSIFTPKGLTDYIAALMKGIQEIMQKCRESLQNTDNHHQLSRVLARFKTSFLTRNFHQIDFYRPWITLVSEFTSHSFANWNLFSNSILYLLTFWSKLFAPCDTKNDNTQLYEEISFRLFNDYLDSHLKSVPYVISNSLDEPLEQIDALQEELDKLAEVARYNYFQVSRSVMQRLGEFSVQFEKMAVTYGADPVLECQLAWLVYVTAAMINGRSPYPPSADVQTPNLDGDLSARVILLLRVHDNRLPRITAESVDFVIHAERSFLQFFSSFRKVYFGELMNPVVKVFERLSELVGVKSNTKTLELIIMKVTSNLVCWSNQPFIISKTLELFKDLTSGYNISKQITKLEIIDNLLQHHTSERFSFLDNPSNFKSRTSYYTTLGRILFNNKNLDRFDAFMAPFSQRFQILMNNQLSPADSKLLLVGLFRDLIGIMLACQTREIYETLFEWLYPNLTMMMGNAAEIYFEDPDVISPLLKLTDQLTSNIMGRLAFPNSSPNGILLFREISNIIVRYGRKLLLLEVPEKKEYRCKFKGIRMCMEILSRASRGNYVNFATFELYNDPTLSDFISIVTKLALSIPTNKLFSYPKVLVSFYNMLEVICQAHFFKYIVTNERNALPQLFDLLFEGIRRIELNVFNESCNAMDNIVASFITAKKRNQEVAQILSSHAASQFPRFVNLFFQMLLYVDTASPWTIAKPLLGLILIDTSEMNSVCQSLMVSQKEENQQKIFELFQNLTTGISNTLLAQNRDVFTHNINNFRRDIKNFITL